MDQTPAIGRGEHLVHKRAGKRGLSQAPWLKLQFASIQPAQDEDLLHMPAMRRVFLDIDSSCSSRSPGCIFTWKSRSNSAED